MEILGNQSASKKAIRRHPRKLTQAIEFKAVLAADCRRSGKNYLLRANSNELDGARLGLIASRKAARRAVDRNRGKRLAREAFMAMRTQLPKVDIVLQLKNNLRTTGNAELRGELDRLLREIKKRFGVFNPDPQPLDHPPV